jgi:hypothetical protein
LDVYVSWGVKERISWLIFLVCLFLVGIFVIILFLSLSLLKEKTRLVKASFKDSAKWLGFVSDL